MDSWERTDIQKRNDKFYCNDSFSVATITYKDCIISSLSIVNNKNKVVYVKGVDNSVHSVSSLQMEMLKKELARTGVGADDVKARYNVDSLEDMPNDIYKRVMSALSKTKSTGVA